MKGFVFRRGPLTDAEMYSIVDTYRVECLNVYLQDRGLWRRLHHDGYVGTDELSRTFESEPDDASLSDRDTLQVRKKREHDASTCEDCLSPPPNDKGTKPQKSMNYDVLKRGKSRA